MDLVPVVHVLLHVTALLKEFKQYLKISQYVGKKTSILFKHGRLAAEFLLHVSLCAHPWIYINILITGQGEAACLW